MVAMLGYHAAFDLLYKKPSDSPLALTVVSVCTHTLGRLRSSGAEINSSDYGLGAISHRVEVLFWLQ
jgi:hypothetical protein